MLIDRVSRQLTAAPELAPLVRALDAGEDASLSVAQSARPLVLAALWARSPRPCLLVVSGEDKARAVRDSFFGPVTPKVPASVLQFHHDVTVVADEAALSLC